MTERGRQLALAGKRVLITGATSGIGLAGACRLAAQGAAVTIVARDPARAERAVALISGDAGSGAVADVLDADLSSQASVQRLAARALERYERIHVLINNAGAIHARRRVSVDGLELTWAVNHLAAFLLTNLLLDRVKQSAPARIITTTSDAHKGVLIPFDDLQAERGYPRQGFIRYGQTKLANILFTVELARRLAGTGVTANCFHPGLVATGFNRNNGPLMSLGMTLIRPFAKSAAKGAEGMVWLAGAPEAASISGAYFVGTRRAMPSGPAQDDALARRLWEVSEQQTGLAGR